jgi:hypothetical protein
MNRFATLGLIFLAGYVAATPMAPQVSYNEMHDMVLRNTQRLVELEHDVRVLEDWRGMNDKSLTEHSVADAIKFAELETTVHAHERLLWVMATILLGITAEVLYRIAITHKRRENHDDS